MEASVPRGLPDGQRHNGDHRRTQVAVQRRDVLRGGVLLEKRIQNVEAKPPSKWPQENQVGYTSRARTPGRLVKALA